MSTPQTWHYGLIAEWWAEFNKDGPEIDYFGRFVAAGQPALDAGCGTGRLLLPWLRAGLDVDGCDVSADMVELCRDARPARRARADALRLSRCTSSTRRGATARSSSAASSASAARARRTRRRSAASTTRSSRAARCCSTTRSRTPSRASGGGGRRRNATGCPRRGPSRGRASGRTTGRSTTSARARRRSTRSTRRPRWRCARRSVATGRSSRPKSTRSRCARTSATSSC